MCGLSAILRFGASAAIDLDDLARMHGALRHRGPDGEGCFTVSTQMRGSRFDRVPERQDVNDPLSLVAAVRRLRVSDLRLEADQPLVSPDGSTCLMLNGAIYNHRAIAAELAGAGFRFRTTNDAEAVMWAYRQWGTGCFAKLEGMWAILIIDLERGKLIGSRDRLGIKPLYYAVEEHRVLLCSEPGPLARIQAGGPRVEEARFFEFLSGYPPRSSALSFFRAVEPVPAASWFEIDLRAGRAAAPKFEPYWNLADFRSGNRSPELSFAEAAQRYRELLQSAVDSHSAADVKAGSLLSGGLDTSTLVALWAERASKRGHPRPDTYSIAWADPKMSERASIEAIASKAGVRNHVLQLSAPEVWDGVDRVVGALAQPLLGQELIAQHHAYGLAKSHGAVVVFDGSGSDELLAGLPLYEAEVTLERFERLQWLDLARELHCMARAYRRSHVRIVRNYLVSPWLRHYRESRGLPEYSWLDARAAGSSADNWTRSRTVDAGADPSRVNRLLYRETRHTNVPTTLLYGDRNSMAHSIEARFPYLDRQLVEFCFSMPPSYKAGFGRRKRLLFETAKDYLPDVVLERRDKMKFVPTTAWMPLRARSGELRDAARNEAFTKVPWIDCAKMHSFVDDFLAGHHDNAYAVWRIYTASRWLNLFAL
jgi:asparagine synthase (glutamine-hydrolysing)